MKGLVPLFLGIFGTFAFSWAGLTMIPNAQIGHLDPQMDEDGNDPYPAPKSGMADHGRRIYAANGCVYCHSQQVRPDYAAGDIDRKWGERRSAPRDYLFERPTLLGKMRMGPDLANIGKRAPSDDANAPAPASTDSTAAAAAPPASAAPGVAASAPAAASAGSPVAAAAPPAGAPAAPAVASPAAAGGAVSPAAPPGSPAAKPASAAASPAPTPGLSPAPAIAAAPPAAATGAPPAAATGASPAPAVAAPTAESPVSTTAVSGEPLQYSAAWHHRHLYAPRSIAHDSNMPAYRFLYEKREIGGQPAADALKLTGPAAPPEGWEIVPTYDAKCLVAYLMSLDQSHALKEVKASAPAPPAAPGKAVK